MKKKWLIIGILSTLLNILLFLGAIYFYNHKCIDYPRMQLYTISYSPFIGPIQPLLIEYRDGYNQNKDMKLKQKEIDRYLNEENNYAVLSGIPCMRIEVWSYMSLVANVKINGEPSHFYYIDGICYLPFENKTGLYYAEITVYIGQSTALFVFYFSYTRENDINALYENAYNHLIENLNLTSRQTLIPTDRLAQGIEYKDELLSMSCDFVFKLYEIGKSESIAVYAVQTDTMRIFTRNLDGSFHLLNDLK